MAEIVSLSPGQTRAIIALLEQSNIKQAAQAANVAERTLYRWLADDAFRQALNEAEGMAIGAASRRLVKLTERALDVVEVVMNDIAAHPNTRLKAADMVLSNLLRLRDLATVEARLARLEESL